MKPFKYILCVSLWILCVFASYSQIDRNQLIGAWTAEFEDENGSYVGVGIIADGFFSVSKFNVANKKFVSTLGGSWALEGDTMHETLEYNTGDPESVGEVISSKIKIDEQHLTFLGINEKWTRLDAGQPGKLSGAWLITGRERSPCSRVQSINYKKAMLSSTATRKEP